MFAVTEICSLLLLIVGFNVGRVFPPCLQQTLSQITLVALQIAFGITYGAHRHYFVLLSDSTIFIILLRRSSYTWDKYLMFVLNSKFMFVVTEICYWLLLIVAYCSWCWTCFSSILTTVFISNHLNCPSNHVWHYMWS